MKARTWLSVLLAAVVASFCGSFTFLLHPTAKAALKPYAGITAFSQMHSFVQAYEQHDLARRAKPTRLGLRKPMEIEGRTIDTVTVSENPDEPLAASADAMWMVPLQTPLAATSFTSH